MIHRHQPPRLHAQFACPGAEAGSIAHRSIMCPGIGTRVKIINDGRHTLHARLQHNRRRSSVLVAELDDSGGEAGFEIDRSELHV